MKNSIVWGFCGEDGRSIVNELRRSLLVTDWFSDQEGAIDILGLLRGEIPPEMGRSVRAVDAFGDIFQQHFRTYHLMLSRRGTSFSDIHEITNEFALTYYYFFNLLQSRNTELVVFSNLPHEGPDYLLYQIARLFSVKTLMCYQSLFPNRFFITTTIDDFGQFQRIPEVFKDAQIALEEGHAQKLTYMNEVEKLQARQQQSAWGVYWTRLFRRSKRFLRLRINILGLLAESERLNTLSVDREIVEHNSIAEYEARIARHVIDRDELRRLLKSSRRLVYFPLHLQPELTTSTIGGVFQDQLYAIEALRTLLGDDWIILVKENPKQTYYQRGKLFFDRLDAIPGVFLVDKLFPSLEIIESVTLTATISGTAGWEAIKGGGRCIVFGQAWYASLGNCLVYHSALGQEELTNFLGTECSFAEFKNSFDQLMKRTGEGVTDESYKTLVNDYDLKINATRVARSLMAVVNHKEVAW